jgi:hypothetical protein
MPDRPLPPTCLSAGCGRPLATSTVGPYCDRHREALTVVVELPGLPADRWIPDEVAPSGRYGFLVDEPGEAGPVVRLVQRIGAGTPDERWGPTPASYYAATLAARPAGPLAIDFGAGWGLSDADTAAFVAFAQRIHSW